MITSTLYTGENSDNFYGFEMKPYVAFLEESTSAVLSSNTILSSSTPTIAKSKLKIWNKLTDRLLEKVKNI